LIVAVAVAQPCLVALAVYLIATAIGRIHHYDRLIAEFKRRHSKLAELLD
jgi:hypothetical protein